MVPLYDPERRRNRPIECDWFGSTLQLSAATECLFRLFYEVGTDPTAGTMRTITTDLRAHTTRNLRSQSSSHPVDSNRPVTAGATRTIELDRG